MKRLTANLALTLVLSACGNSEPDTMGNTDPGAQKVSIAGTGFYNSEKPEFSPSSIGYSFIDQKAVYINLDQRLVAADYTVISLDAFFNDVIKSAGRKVMSPILQQQLAFINEWLQTADDSCSSCSELSIPPLASRDDWTAEDRFVMVFALETRSPSGRGLRSGFGAFLFDGTGKFVDHSFREYDFTSFTTDKFRTMMADLVTDLGLELGDVPMGTSEDQSAP